MRNIATAFIAFVVSALVAGVSTVMLAERAQAQDAYALVFMAVAPFALLMVVPLLIASYRPEPKAAVTRVARWLAILIVLMVAGLFGYSFYVAQAQIGVVENLPILSALAIPASVILVVQWLVFRLRSRAPAPAPMQFGRTGSSA